MCATLIVTCPSLQTTLETLRETHENCGSLVISLPTFMSTRVADFAPREKPVEGVHQHHRRKLGLGDRNPKNYMGVSENRGP